MTAPAQSSASQIWRFATVGVAGFVVDAGVLYGLMALGAGAYGARLASFFCAASATWLLNRLFTFKTRRRGQSIWREWLGYLAVALTGGAANYLAYAAIVAALPAQRLAPLAGVALGSLAGMAFNFTLSRRYVFAAHRGDHRLSTSRDQA